jgi:hypothetical protein
MLQYKCNLELPKKKGDAPSIVCEPLVHLLRR